MHEVVALPHRHAALFVWLWLQGNGTFSRSKRQLPEYDAFADPEIMALETAVAGGFSLGPCTKSEP